MAYWHPFAAHGTKKVHDVFMAHHESAV